MKLIRKVGSTSEIWQIFIQDSTSTTGAGLTGLAHNSAGLTAYYHRDTDTTATAITLVTMTVGTFTSSGFKEIDATNMPGWYQFCPPNAALASGAKSCGFHLKGANNMAPLPIEVDLDAQVDVTFWNGTAVKTPTTAGVPEVCMTDAVAHGGTLGSSTATLALSRANITSQTSNTAALVLAGNGSGAGASATGGATGHGMSLVGGATSGNGLRCLGNGSSGGFTAVGGATGTGIAAVGGASSGAGISVTTTSGDGVSITPTAGNGITVTANGTSKHGVQITGGTGGTSDGLKLVAGTGGVGFRLDTLTASGAVTATNAANDIRGIQVNSLSTAGAASFFNVNSGTNYGAAVAGSVVYEILAGQEAGDLTAAEVWAYASRTLTAAGLDAIVVETGLNARQALSIIAASQGGTTTGAGTSSFIITGAGVATTRITATVNALTGERTAVVLSPPA